MSVQSEKNLTPHYQLQRAQQLMAQNEPEQALACLKQGLVEAPDNVPMLAQATALSTQLKKFEDACVFLRKQLALNPGSSALRYELAIRLMETGDLTGAESEMRVLIKKKSREYAYYNLLGVILKRQKRYPEALEILGKAAKLKPGHHSVWVNMGNIHLIMENGHKAAECFTRAMKINPQDSENYRLLGNALVLSGDTQKGLAHFQNALRLNAQDPRIRMDICGYYYNLSEFEAAISELDKSLAAFPGHLGMLRMKGMCLRGLGRYEEAITLLEDLARQHPNDAETLGRLANVYFLGLGNREKANVYYEKAYQLAPDNEYIALMYIDSLRDSRYGNEAEHLEKAYGIAKQLLNKTALPFTVADAVHGILLRVGDFDALQGFGERDKLIQYWVDKMRVGALHNQLGRVTTLEDRYNLVEAHRQWGKKIEEEATKRPIQHAHARIQKEKIRIGLMSSDLRHHPVTYFVEPILEKYDKSRFELHCYSFFPQEPDWVQQRVMETVDGFHLLHTLRDYEIAQKIADDQLDILFELGGSTRNNKLEVMAYRPAPVQVSWLGYPHSSGLSTIDYILVDPYLKPEDPQLLIEKPFEMPETWVSLGRLGFPDELPVEPGIPQDRHGFITFGTMNNPYKYTPQLIQTWAEIMQQVPGSHFVFVRPECGAESFRKNMTSRFQQHGIEPHRIDFVAVRGNNKPFYNAMDISLDTFPHVGGTTSCESLWMGVPVITLVGPAFFERLTYSNLQNAGLGDLCAFSREDYVACAVNLAREPERRRELRQTLRKRIMENPLGQSERFVRHFESQIIKVLEGHGG